MINRFIRQHTPVLIKLFIGISLIAVTARSGYSQGLSGTVTDENGTPVAGAQLVFLRIDPPDSLTRGTVADADGRYRVSLPPGRYQFRVRMIGLTSVTGEATVAAAGATSSRNIVITSGTAPLPNLPASRHFDLYDINYFAFGWSSPEAERPKDENANQVKFRVSIRYKLLDVFSCDSCRTGVYVAFSQTSFWHLYDESGPFFDNNYSPGALYFHSFREEGETRPLQISAFVGYFHESNGRDLAFSRSWDRLMAGVSWGSLNEDLFSGSLTVWHASGFDSTNLDLPEFAGRGELELYFQPHAHAGNGGPLTLQIRSRILGDHVFQNVEANMLWQIPGKHVFPDAFVQVFSGYAENLLTYREKRTVLRIGLAVLR
jgi:phospholipase A1/A2